MTTPPAPSGALASADAPSFADLGVPAELVETLARGGITHPFDIQVATISDALAGRDVLGRAPTGSGKTLAFGIPLIAQLDKGAPRRPKGLILSPTRELAEQIRRELQPLAKARGLSVLAIYGGVGFRDQLQGLRNGADVLVACPGRLQDLLSQGEVSLSEVNRVVVDEADRMADMGFLPAVRQLLDLTSDDRQTVLFSATLDKEVAVLTKNYQQNPVTHEVGEAEPDLSTMTHRFILTEKEGKIRLAADLIDEAGPTVVFCRTRHGVDRVARQLKRVGVKAGWIHGGRSQNQRDAALHAFTTGKVQALIATDVAARGIHVDGVACVIHYDPPQDHKDYVHRSGRTARAGASGLVVSFVNSDQVKATSKLQRAAGLPKSDFEQMPELTERELVSWVDERPKKGRGGKNGSPKNGSAKNGAKSNSGNGRAKQRAPKQNAGTGERSAQRSEGDRDDSRGDGTSKAGATSRSGRGSGTRSGSTRPARSGPGGRKQASGKGQGAGKGTGQSKRSGKPRPKNKRRGPRPK